MTEPERREDLRGDTVETPGTPPAGVWAPVLSRQHLRADVTQQSAL